MKKYFFLLLTVLGCQSNEADIPELLTKLAQQIGTTSVVMEGEIKEIGPVRPVNYGFLWDIQQDISIASAKNKVVLGSANEPRLFSIKLDNLTPATAYYYRSFAANTEYTKFYYGDVVTFTTLP